MINKETNKKILLISYHFPPSLAVGGFRIAGFAEKLPLYGWDPYVLTIKEKVPPGSGAVLPPVESNWNKANGTTEA